VNSNPLPTVMPIIVTPALVKKQPLPLLMLRAQGGQGESDDSGAEPLSAKRMEALPSLDGVRVLVVDDEPDALLLLSEILSQCGAAVRMPASGEESFSEMKRLQPNVIISDIGMPKENGYTFMRRVRRWTQETGGGADGVHPCRRPHAGTRLRLSDPCAAASRAGGTGHDHRQPDRATDDPAEE
jgi:CheY-like chemotaxis protein